MLALCSSWSSQNKPTKAERRTDTPSRDFHDLVSRVQPNLITSLFSNSSTLFTSTIEPKSMQTTVQQTPRNKVGSITSCVTEHLLSSTPESWHALPDDFFYFTVCAQAGLLEHSLVAQFRPAPLVPDSMARVLYNHHLCQGSSVKPAIFLHIYLRHPVGSM